MIKPNKIFLVLLVTVFVSSKTFAQKKNSLTYQIGILNYFYNEQPIFFNLAEIENMAKIRHFTESVLIKSRGLSYTRSLNDKSNLTILAADFHAFYAKNAITKDNSLYPLITGRSWHFFGLEYNRVMLEKVKFKLFYGGGFTFRNGIEHFKVLQIQTNGGWGESITETVRVRNIGATLNINMRYDLWKRFFLYSKIDFQGYFHQADIVTQDFKRLNDQWQTREFEPSSRINHTLTIGMGIEF